MCRGRTSGSTPCAPSEQHRSAWASKGHLGESLGAALGVLGDHLGEVWESLAFPWGSLSSIWKALASLENLCKPCFCLHFFYGSTLWPHLSLSSVSLGVAGRSLDCIGRCSEILGRSLGSPCISKGRVGAFQVSLTKGAEKGLGHKGLADC